MSFESNIKKIVKAHELPYLSVRVFKGYDLVLKYNTENATGLERLQMYSMSKIFTVVSIMQLIEQGKLSLKDKVERFFPCFKKTTYLKGEKIKKNRTKTTIKHLLMMTSGLTYDTDTPRIKALRESAYETATLKDFIPAFVGSPLAFKSGTSYTYGLSHDVLAGIVEIVSGMSFDEYVRKNIFDKLETQSATFKNDFTNVYEKYECKDDLSVVPTTLENALLFSKNYISGGAGLISNVEDYSKLVKALTNGGVAENGQRILSKESIDALTKSPLSNEFVKHSFNWQGNEYGYGLGVRVRLVDNDFGLNKGEFGWDGACGSFWLSDPTSGISVVMGMNILSWNKRYLGIHTEILKEIYAELSKK